MQVVVPIVVSLIAAAVAVWAERRRAAIATRAQDAQSTASHDSHQLQHQSFGLDVLEASLAELHEKSNSQGGEISTLSGRLDECESGRSELRDEIEGMAEANRQMRIAVDESRDDRIRLGRRVSDLTAQLDELRHDVNGS